MAEEPRRDRDKARAEALNSTPNNSLELYATGLDQFRLLIKRFEVSKGEAKYEIGATAIAFGVSLVHDEDQGKEWRAEVLEMKDGTLPNFGALHVGIGRGYRPEDVERMVYTAANLRLGSIISEIVRRLHDDGVWVEKPETLRTVVQAEAMEQLKARIAAKAEAKEREPLVRVVK